MCIFNYIGLIFASEDATCTATLYVVPAVAWALLQPHLTERTSEVIRWVGAWDTTRLTFQLKLNALASNATQSKLFRVEGMAQRGVRLPQSILDEIKIRDGKDWN